MLIDRLLMYPHIMKHDGLISTNYHDNMDERFNQMNYYIFRLFSILYFAVLLLQPVAARSAERMPSRIEVIERGSGWPVPLVILRTTGHVRFVTDNAGVIAIDEPDFMNREVFFHVEGHGYEVPRDGFGYRGVRLRLQPGKTFRIEVNRKIIAKRLGRITGAGMYAHSQKLGPFADWQESGVIGCDSVQSYAHRGRHFWLWGDTRLAHYPLGIFHASSATTKLKPLQTFEPPVQIAFDYFRDEQGRPRGVAKMPGRGPTWLSGYVSLPDQHGKQHLVATYSKIKKLLHVYETGLCVWNDESENFEKLKTLWTESKAAAKPPALPNGHPVFWNDQQGNRWVLFGNPLPTLRCRATFEAWQDPSQWEPLQPQETLIAADSGQSIKPHSGSIAWNASRSRWVTVFLQWFGKPSAFGELWYAEAESPTGPWGLAVKILSHNNYTFYNPRIHPEFTPEDSPVLLFEGTYTKLFADKPQPTPRYDYNQILYRLDLDDERLKPARKASLKTESLEPIRVSPDGTHFMKSNSDERFVVWGVNYDHDGSGHLLDEYWIEEWDTVVEDFREMKAFGANCVRIHLQLGKFMDAPDKPNSVALKQLAKLVTLAEQTGLYLNVTGLACYHKKNIPEWYDSLEEQNRWAVQATFWEAVAKTCSQSPAIFCYDLMNEPVLPGKKPAKEWLAGELGGKYFVQRLSLDLGNRTRKQVAAAWVNKMVAAIRKQDSQHMITVGVIPWVFAFGGGKPLFYSPEVGMPLDFVSVHFYPKKGEVDQAVKALKAYEVGKPLVVEEMFPLKCSVAELSEFINKSAAHTDGWISFYWGQKAEELKAKDKPTIGDAVTAEWLEKFSELSGKMKTGKISKINRAAAHDHP